MTTITRGPSLLAGSIAIALVAVSLAGAPAGQAATTRSFTITSASAQPSVAFKAFDGNPPKTFDVDGDGRQEILAQNDNDYAYVFDSGTGALLAELKTTFPYAWGARTFNGPEAYREGGVTHLVLQNSAAYIASFRFEPAASTATHFAFTKEWERRMTDCFGNPGSDAKPVLADLDRDGHTEILVATEEVGLYALRGSGGLLWAKCIGGGNAEMEVGDLDTDGWPDVVYGSDAGVITAMNGRTGATLWSYSLLSHFDLGSASLPVGPAIAQLDGVGGPDIVVGARDSHNGSDFTQDHAMLVALDSAGRLLWARQDPTGNPLTYTHPVVVDAAGDGQSEVYWGDWNTIGHKPPDDEAQAWRVTGPAHFYRYDASGNLVWRQTLATFWSNKDLALADADGDGAQEVLAAGPDASGHEGIWSLDALTGAKESFADAYPWMVARGPVVADLRGSGTMQWVLEVNPMATSAGPAIQVYDTGVPYNAKWPHLPDYASTGAPPPATPTPSPPAGDFAATFTIKSPNPWWQEMNVQPQGSHSIINLQVRFGSPDWRPMSKASWGAWTSSYNTPAGTHVEFLATDSSGFVSQSLPFTWMDGTLTRGSTSGSGTSSTTTTSTTTTSTSSTTTSSQGSFAATFGVPSGVNEWWVEVAVRANAPLATVEAQVGAAAWTALPATSWGTWAKSIHAPPGSQVTFRATSTSGAVAVSPTFTWMATSGGGGGFAASFTPVAVGNDWWVEVRVSSASSIVNVEANQDGGPWTVLPLQSWGNWAKSIHTPDGTVVRFRATDAAGATLVSEPTTWT